MSGRGLGIPTPFSDWTTGEGIATGGSWFGSSSDSPETSDVSGVGILRFLFDLTGLLLEDLPTLSLMELRVLTRFTPVAGCSSFGGCHLAGRSTPPP